MQYVIRKIRDDKFYTVKNPINGRVHSYHTTLKNAKAQVRLLNAIEHGYVIPKSY